MIQLAKSANAKRPAPTVGKGRALTLETVMLADCDCEHYIYAT